MNDPSRRHGPSGLQTASGAHVTVTRRSRLWTAANAPRTSIEAAVIAAITASRRSVPPRAEVAVSLVGDRAIRILNRTWRGIDKPTNVLSFPAAAPPPGSPAMALGDIAIAFETTAREAADECKALTDHLAHLVVHGTLHLLGFDHTSPDEATAMERIEIEALASIGITDPYRDTVPVDARTASLIGAAA